MLAGRLTLRRAARSKTAGEDEMRMNSISRRVSYIFLCTVPFLAIAFGAPRALRIPGVFQAIGGALFAAVLIAAWILGARVIRGSAQGEQRLAFAGVFLNVPFALVLLLWVGLGPPWVATAPENLMRYLVLLAS